MGISKPTAAPEATKAPSVGGRVGEKQGSYPYAEGLRPSDSPHALSLAAPPARSVRVAARGARSHRQRTRL